MTVVPYPGQVGGDMQMIAALFSKPLDPNTIRPDNCILSVPGINDPNDYTIEVNFIPYGIFIKPNIASCVSEKEEERFICIFPIKIIGSNLVYFIYIYFILYTLHNPVQQCTVCFTSWRPKRPATACCLATIANSHY